MFVPVWLIVAAAIIAPVVWIAARRTFGPLEDTLVGLGMTSVFLSLTLSLGFFAVNDTRKATIAAAPLIAFAVWCVVGGRRRKP